MLSRVGPGIAVVDVEQKFKAFCLDALPESHDIGQVLANALALILGIGLGRINEQAHAHGIQALALEITEHVGNSCTILVIIDGAMFLILSKKRNVTAHPLGPGVAEQTC